MKFSINIKSPPGWILNPNRLNDLFILLVLFITGSILIFAWPKQTELKIKKTKNMVSLQYEREPVQPIPLSVKLKPGKVRLGDKLFHDKKLSKNGTVSCASCHDLKKGGTDRITKSKGMNGKVGDINAPTVFNALFNFRQFWDGRAPNLEEQVNGPMGNPSEMAGNWNDIIKYLNNDRSYRTDFLEIYGSQPRPAFVRNAIAEFERSLYTPNSAFDRYLMGDLKALNNNEFKGYQLFKKYGCIACHQGRNIGGNMYQSFGVVGNYFADRKQKITSADLGRFNVTKLEQDKHVFKVPSLRNIALTAPYFHDGSAESLEDAVKIMGRYQLGRYLDKEEIDLIVLFLKTLTGEYKGRPL